MTLSPPNLVGGLNPFWKIWKSIGMMKFPIYGKIKLMFQTTPLKNMKVNWDDEIPNIWENKKWQPNHQPEIAVVIAPIPHFQRMSCSPDLPVGGLMVSGHAEGQATQLLPACVVNIRAAFFCHQALKHPLKSNLRVGRGKSFQRSQRLVERLTVFSVSGETAADTCAGTSGGL